jgi:hypothetical protein
VTVADDIVTRLRAVPTATAENCEELSLLTEEAADEIERLREKGDALAALPVPCECDPDNVCRWCRARIDWETIRLG